VPNELPASDETADHALENAFALVLEAEDSGDWKRLARWLAHNPALGGEVAQFIGDQEKLRGVMKTPPAAPDRTGTTVGGMELGEKVGEGGMGVVYRARDPRLNRDVAVKTLRAAGALALADLVRFRFEAETVAALDHPNIVPVHSFGEEDGTAYLVMPLMADSLAARLKALGPDRLLPPHEAARLVGAIARGAHHAHQRGLIHRDLKPANILLDGDGVPHIADFGLARPIDVNSNTSAGIAGTVPYMAPEQARGEKGLTTAVDVHALGTILFELLTGRTPFGGADVMSVLGRVKEDAAPPVRQFRPAVPRDLELICLKCLKKSPQDRYPSAQALADDLERFLNGEPPCGHGRGWVWDTVSRALGWRRETLAMGTWSIAFWGGASTVLAMGVLQVAVLMNAPLWVSQAAVAYYLIAWLCIIWVFLVAPRDSLNPAERASTGLHFGAKFACAAVLPVQLFLHDGNPVYALPSFLAIVGLFTFAHGVTYWGRMYLSGLFLFAVTAAMPLVPVTYWPTVYGSLLGVMQILVGIHLRGVHKDAEAVRRADTGPPTS
jgi:eukaryotic-like serine/threonine-protein kinase